MTSDLLNRLLETVRTNPGLTAILIAKKLGVTRKEVNSLLYKNNKSLFMRVDHGDKAPTWIIQQTTTQETGIRESAPSIVRSPNPGKAVVRKILEQLEVKLMEDKNFTAQSGGISFEVVLVSEGSNSKYCRYEILGNDDLIVILNEDSYFIESSESRTLRDAAFHVLHCIADCFTEYKMRRTRVSEDQYIFIKNDIFRALLALNLLNKPNSPL